MPGVFDHSKYRAKTVYMSKPFCMEHHVYWENEGESPSDAFLKHLPLGNECNMGM